MSDSLYLRQGCQRTEQGPQSSVWAGPHPAALDPHLRSQVHAEPWSILLIWASRPLESNSLSPSLPPTFSLGHKDVLGFLG